LTLVKQRNIREIKGIYSDRSMNFGGSGGDL
jgi:hypothetical protein